MWWIPSFYTLRILNKQKKTILPALIELLLYISIQIEGIQIFYFDINQKRSIHMVSYIKQKYTLSTSVQKLALIDILLIENK